MTTTAPDTTGLRVAVAQARSESDPNEARDILTEAVADYLAPLYDALPHTVVSPGTYVPGHGQVGGPQTLTDTLGEDIATEVTREAIAHATQRFTDFLLTATPR